MPPEPPREPQPERQPPRFLEVQTNKDPDDEAAFNVRGPSLSLNFNALPPGVRLLLLSLLVAALAVAIANGWVGTAFLVGLALGALALLCKAILS